MKAPAVDAATASELAALKADVQTLKDKAPSAPLATYYYNKAHNHVLWLIRINLAPKGPDGKPVDLKGIFDAIEKKDSMHLAEIAAVSGFHAPDAAHSTEICGS